MIKTEPTPQSNRSVSIPMALLVSHPRGGSNAVARMLSQSPSVSQCLRSCFLESGDAAFEKRISTFASNPRESDMLLVKEHAAFLNRDRMWYFAEQDRFVFLVRNPVEQLASAVVGSMRYSQAVSDAVNRQSAHFRKEWPDIVDYVSETYDFEPATGFLSAVFTNARSRQECADDVQWFDEAVIDVIIQSWARMLKLFESGPASVSGHVSVVDFSLLQTDPMVIVELADSVGMQSCTEMVDGPWAEPGPEFVAGLHILNGHGWVEEAINADHLYDRPARRFDPMSLPEPAKAALPWCIQTYERILSSGHLAGAHRFSPVSVFDGESPNGDSERHWKSLVDAHPVTAWAISPVVCPSFATTQATRSRIRDFAPHLDTLLRRQIIADERA